ncbi:MAG TPA: ADP-forming succinate--CoA ligase subunit beta [Vicinamibacterales bacterium]|nr:ADP-forming succinate--CoA ligase subunit beta [Vicinamibacterales bacterium]
MRAAIVAREVPMKIHEYQAKAILARYGVPVPQGEVVLDADGARAAAEKLGAGTVVVKAQIHAGGRGKGGGVKVVKGSQEARAAAEKMIGMDLVTYQTGPRGQKVQRVLVEQGLRIARELYLGLVLDRTTERPVMMVSSEGGVEIEKVAEEHPDRIFKAFIHPAIGLSAYQTRQLAFALGLEGAQIGQASKLMTAIYDAFKGTDASLVEINPLIVTEDGNLLALDAKMNFDDNALYRHPDIKQLRDLSEEDPLEIDASKFSLNYIKLDGTIGCMVNGAGLAMATMDIIKLAGGEPANFLDVGGGANAEQIKNAFRILMADTAVRAVLINIFGGILRCDVLAEGVIAAVKELGVPVPIVIRMEGTNVEKGKEMLRESGLNFTTADDMNEAAQKVVALGK